jgi:hypothetical protein
MNHRKSRLFTFGHRLLCHPTRAGMKLVATIRCLADADLLADPAKNQPVLPFFVFNQVVDEKAPTGSSFGLNTCMASSAHR